MSAVLRVSGVDPLHIYIHANRVSQAKWPMVKRSWVDFKHGDLGTVLYDRTAGSRSKFNYTKFR